MISTRSTIPTRNARIGAAACLAFIGAAWPGPDAVSAPAVSWQVADGYRWKPAVPAPATRTGFTTVTATQGLGIPFTNHVSAPAALNNQILENGAGVALGDIDGDGLCDVYLCGSEPANALHRNLGNWRFADITAEAGVACAGQFSTGAVLADLDGDSDLDLLVNGLGVGTRLFRNNGQGQFTEDNRSGLVRRHGATSLALADVDGDGDLDLYVTTYRVTSARSESPPPPVEVRRIDNRLVVTPADRFTAFPLADGNVELAEKGEPDHFYLNDGQGRFSEVRWNAGLFLDDTGRPLTASPEDWGLSVLFRDLSGDGLPDLYVCNDFFRSRDQFWIQDHQGRFRPAPALAWRNMSLSSMAADAADIDRDGHDDLLVAEMLSLNHATRHRQRANAFRPQQALPFHDPGYQPELPRNTLFLARGDGSFAEIASFAGLAASDWSWNVAFLDVDLDGFEDVLFATGNAHDVLDLDAQNAMDRAPNPGSTPALSHYPPLRQPPIAFRNQGDLTFTNVSAAWGLTAPGIAQGMAFGDLDNDGDVDVVMNRLHDAALVLRNDAPDPRIAVRLRGLPPNTRGIGAKIRLLGGPVIQSQEVIAGGRYLSSDEPLRTFAATASTTPQELVLEVTWRSGRRSRIPNVSPNRVYEIEEPATAVPPASAPPTAPRSPLFADVSSRLAQAHTQPEPPDFSHQPLLPRALNHAGPGVTWLDWDQDGWDDLLLADGAGRSWSVYRNDRGTRFSPSAISSATSPIPGDTLTVIPWSTQAVLSVNARPSSQQTGPSLVTIHSRPQGSSVGSLPTGNSSAGPIAVADIDSDGDLDVFLGGRHVPGRYPAAAVSHMFLNRNQTLVPDPAFPPELRNAGMVSGAVFTDLDLDGQPDLVLACDWGPIRIFSNQKGRFTESTRSWALADWTGCWAGIATGDFDEDGRPDLIASNLGRNTRHAIPGPGAWRLFAFDADEDGTLEIIEAHRAAGTDAFLPWRGLDVLGRAIPSLQQRFATFRDFGNATVPALLQGLGSPVITVEARFLDHRLFLNRGDRFESRPLPPTAQFAPGFGIAVADFDGDGHLDVFLAQNTFDLDLDSGRGDAGTGLCLIGNGKGGFRALTPAESGVTLHGAQRGVAVADFDQDGRPDLCVAQHNGRTVLLRNTGGQPGLRVRVQGPTGNPHAIGTSLRLRIDGTPTGPAREVQAGSGYLSADSTTLVFPVTRLTASMEVRWPGGRTTLQPIPAGARELTVVP